MALTKCPECGGTVSDKAPRCVHCGVVLDPEADLALQKRLMNTGQKHPQKKVSWALVLSLVVVFALAIGIVGYYIFPRSQSHSSASDTIDNNVQNTISGIVKMASEENEKYEYQPEAASPAPVSTPEPMESTEASSSEIEANTKNVLYDDHGIYIEYRGLAAYYNSSVFIDLYIENNSNETVYIRQTDVKCNRFNLNSISGLVSLSPKSVCLASVNRKFKIDFDDLKAYGVTNINSIDFSLKISTGQWVGGNDIVDLPVHLDEDYPLP